jgi:hypothetical protein
MRDYVSQSAFMITAELKQINLETRQGIRCSIELSERRLHGWTIGDLYRLVSRRTYV